MSYAAEPYGVFVDDLVSGLTGGIVREENRYPSESGPARLGFQGDFLPKTVRVHGIVEGAFVRFAPDRDYTVDADGVVAWIADTAAGADSGARRPDRGSRFYVSYERKPENRPAPALTDRNPGSVLRTLAESFAREYAVISRQMERVYQAGFLETATERDLDQLVALLGMERRTPLYAGGEVVFSRATPAPADIFIPAGTRISTSDAPPVTVETGESRTLRGGSLSVAAPVRALVSGTDGVALAETLTVIHRPILGVDAATNPRELGFAGARESDPALRSRASRALERGGASTINAIVSALATIEGIRQQDVRVKEDHVNHPGLIKITVAAELTPEQSARAVELIRANRPAGVRVLHNLPATPDVVPVPGEDSGGEPATEPPASGAGDGVWYPLEMRVTVVPAVATLNAEERKTLTDAVRAALIAKVDELGIGQPVIYNALVAAAMGVEGVGDVLVEVFPAGAAGGRSNILVPEGARATISEEDVGVEAAGALVALDLTVTAERKGRLLLQDRDQAMAVIRDAVADLLGEWLGGGPAEIGQSLLLGQLPATDDYAVDELTFRAEYIDQGVMILEENPDLTLADDEQPWLRSLSVTAAPEEG